MLRGLMAYGPVDRLHDRFGHRPHDLVGTRRGVRHGGGEPARVRTLLRFRAAAREEAQGQQPAEEQHHLYRATPRRPARRARVDGCVGSGGCGHLG
ncbi:hypothetical protein B5180_12820 [Streptomyces sp. BF-3]|nr:hypothetical protein B5180_12820 [Streptomyces sp. BF-3]